MKVFSVFLFLILVAAVPVSAASVNSPEEAAELVLEELLEGSFVGKIVYSLPRAVEAGEILGSWNSEVVVPIDGYLVLIDDMALANWEHPCRWVFVGFEGNMEIIRKTTPPDALPRMTEHCSDLPIREPMSLLDSFVPNPRDGTDDGECYALLVSGGANAANNRIRYYGDIQFIYLTLTDDYGYTNDDIIICFADGLDPAPDNEYGESSNPDLDGDLIDDFDYDATFNSVTTALAEMAGLAGADDHVLIFATDHGGSNGGYEVYLNLWNSEQLDDDVFDTFIDEINSASLHVVMEQCFSGGFIDEVIPTTGGQPRTFASAAAYNQSSYAGTTYPDYDEWCYWWTGAMHGSVPPGGSLPGGALPYDPDANLDGFVDYREAFNCSEDWDTASETPQYDDDPDSCGYSYYLGGLIQVGIESDDLLNPVTGFGIGDNPFTTTASFNFNLTENVKVEVIIYDISGRKAGILTPGILSEGEHSINWNTSDISTGVYFCMLRAGSSCEVLKVLKL